MATTETIFIAVDVETGDSVKGLEKLRADLKGVEAEIKSVERARKRGTITAKEANSQLTKLDTTLKKNRKSYNEAQKAASGFNKETSSFGKLGKTLTDSYKKVGAAIAGAFALGAIISGIKNTIGIIKDFEQGNANLAAVLGTSKEGIQALTADAKRLGSATAFTASQVSELQTEFAKLGFNQKQILAATEATLALAAATGSELGEAAAIAGATLGGFGLAAEETQRVVDVMAKSFSTSALDMEKFKESMKSAAPAARAVGISVEETTALLGTLANAGIAGSKAGNNLKTSLINLNAAGLSLDEGLTKVANSSNKLDEATKLVGKNAAASFLVLAEGRDVTDRLTEGLQNAGGAADRMAKTQLDTLEGKTKLLSSAWEGFVLSLDSGDSAVSNLIGGFLEMTTSMLGSVTAQDSLSTSLIQTNAELNAEFELLKNGNITQEERAGLIEGINSKYSEYLPNLLTEASSLKEIEAAQKGANAALKEKIVLAGAQEQLTELTKEAVDAQAELFATQLEIEELKSGARKAAKVITRGPGGQTQENANAIRVKNLERGLAEQEAARDKAAKRVATFQELNNDLLLKAQGEASTEAVEIVKTETTETEKAVKDKTEKQLAAEKVKTDKLAAAAEKARQDELSATQAAEDELFQFQLTEDEKEIQAVNDKYDKILALGVASAEEEKQLLIANQAETDAILEERRVVQEEKLVEENELELERREEKRQEALAFAAQGLQAIQDLTNVFSTNKLKALDAEAKAELDIINTNEAQKLADENLTEAQRTEIKDNASAARLKLEQDTDKQQQELEKKAFQRNKAFQLAQVALNLASQISAIQLAAALNPTNAATFGASGVAQAAVQTGIAVAAAALNIGAIAAQKFEKGGILAGPSHAQGGIGLSVGGNIVAEAEGGEPILTKGVSQNPSLLAAASRINVMGGGKPLLQDGGITPNFDLPTADTGEPSEIIVQSQVSVVEIMEVANNVQVTESKAQF